jgi:hypothetical protein
LSLVVNKHRALRALLGRPQFVELRSTYREANGRVKKAVVVDANIFVWKQVEVVECLQQAGRPRQWV